MTAAKPLISEALDAASEELEDDAEWTAVVASGDYVGQQAEGLDFSDVVVRRGRWSGVILERFKAANVVFDGCDLSGLVLREDCSLLRVAFEGCRMSGAVLSGTRFRHVRFSDCTLDDATLRMIDAEDAEFENCALVGADFYGATLAKTRVAGCDLRGAIFTKASVAEVDLRTSRLEDVVGADSLRGSTIASDQLIPFARSLATALAFQIVDDDEQ